MNETIEKLFGPVQTESGYFYAAKAALFLVAVLLGCILVGTVIAMFRGGHADQVGTLISCCQAISFIAISVMGYHLGGRSRNKTLKNEAITDAISDGATD